MGLDIHDVTIVRDFPYGGRVFHGFVCGRVYLKLVAKRLNILKRYLRSMDEPHGVTLIDPNPTS